MPPFSDDEDEGKTAAIWGRESAAAFFAANVRTVAASSSIVERVRSGEKKEKEESAGRSARRGCALQTRPFGTTAIVRLCAVSSA